MASPTSQRRIHAAAVRLFADIGANTPSVSALASNAGVARGTVYAYLNGTDDLFEQTATDMAAELHRQIEHSLGNTQDPARRVAAGITYFLHYTHSKPDWGKFLCKHGLSAAHFSGLLRSQPAQDVERGIQTARFKLSETQLMTATAMLSGSVLAAVQLVLAGHKGWRSAAEEVSTFMLLALGVEADEAQAIARAESHDNNSLINSENAYD